MVVRELASTLNCRATYRKAQNTSAIHELIKNMQIFHSHDKNEEQPYTPDKY